MLKRLLGVFLTLLLLLGGVLVTNNTVYAQEEEGITEGSSQSFEESEENTDSEGSEEIILEEDEFSSEESEEPALSDFEDENKKEDMTPEEEAGEIKEETASIEEYDPTDPYDPQKSTSFYQDQDSGDIYITSENPIWLAELEEKLMDENHDAWVNSISMYTDGSYTRFIYLTSYPNKVEFIKNGDQLSGIRISIDVLYGLNTPSGRVTFNLPGTASFYQVEYTFEDLKACADVPEGLLITETEAGIKLYYDNPDQEQLDFLRALARPEKYINNGGGLYDHGSNIKIRNMENSKYYGYFSNRIWVNADGTRISGNNEYTLSEDGDYILIPRDEILGGYDSNVNLINGISYKVILSAYGYVDNSDLEISDLSQAKQTLPDDFAFNAEFDDNGDLRIYSEQHEWLVNTCLSTLYDEDGQRIRRGGTFALRSDDSGNWLWLSNYEYQDNRDSRLEYELKTDDEGKEYIHVSRKVLINRISNSNGDYSEGTKCYFVFQPYSFENYSSNPEKEGEFIILNGLVKRLPDFSIDENDDGDIVLSGSGEDYVAFAKSFAEDYDAYLSFYANQTEYAVNFFDKYYRSEHKPTISEDGTIAVPHEALLEHSVPCGEVRVTIQTFGYPRYQTTLELQHACKEVPPEINVEFDSHDNLVISSEEQWVDAFFADNEDQNNNIRLLDGNSWKYWISKDDCVRNGNDIVVSKDTLMSKAIEGGTYTVRIQAYGYAVAFINGFEFKNLLKDIDFDINVYFENGDLIVECDEEDYLDALTKESVREQKNGSWEWIGQYSNINIYNTNKAENRFGQGFTWYNDVFIYENGNHKITTKINKVSDRKAVIEREWLLQDDLCFDNDTTEIRLSAFGYPQITKKNISVRGVRERRVPEGLDVRSDENGDLIITSKDDAWLKDLCINRKYTENGYSAGGAVEFVIYGEDGWSSTFISISPSGSDRSFIYSPGKVTIKSETLKDNGVKNGEYYVILMPRNYMRIETSEPVLITGGNKANPTGIAARLEDNGDLVVYSQEKNENADFLKALVKPYVYDEKHEIVSFGGRIWIRDEAKYNSNINNYVYADGQTFESMVYDEKNNEVRISRNKMFYTSGNCMVSVYSYGYGGSDDLISIPLDMPYIIRVYDNGHRWDEIFQIGDEIPFEVRTDRKVNWSVDDLEIASISDKGIFTALKPGVVHLSAQIEGNDYIDTIPLTIDGSIDIEKGVKLIAQADGYDATMGIETDESFTLTVSTKDEEIDPFFLIFSSSNPNIASIDENGVVTAHKAGIAKITAKLDGDPYKRSVIFVVKVINRILYSMEFEVDDSINKYYDENGVLNLCFDADTDVNKTFRILTFGKDDPIVTEDTRTVLAEAVAYSPIDSKVASISKDGVISVKKAGQTSVKATITSNPKEMDPVSREFIIRVIDLAPKLESAKANVNKYYDNGTDVKIYAVKGSEIKSVELHNAKSKETDFIVTYNEGDDHFNIRQGDSVKAETKGKTYNETLTVALSNGKEYEYKYTVVVNTTLPKATFKQSGVYNTALDVNTLKMQVDVKDAEISKIEFNAKEGDENWASIDEAGNISLLKENDKGQKILKGTVRVYFEGYSDERAFAKTTMNFKSSNALPTARLESAVPDWFSKNTLALNSNFITSYSLDLLSSEESYPIVNATIKDGDKYDGLSVTFENGSIKAVRDPLVFMKDGTYKYVITPFIVVDGTEKALKTVTLNVKITDVLPKVTLSSSSVKLNKRYDEEIALDVKVSNLPAGAAINYFKADSDLVSLDFDGDQVLKLKLNDRLAVDKGTYTVELMPVFSNARSSAPIKMKISVLDIDAKAAISVKGSLNQFDPNSVENCLGTIKITNTVSDVKEVKTNSDLVNAVFDPDSGKISFTLKERDIKDTTLKAVPIEIVLNSGEKVPTSVNLKVARKAPVVKLETNKLSVYDVSYQNVEVGTIELSKLPFGEIADIWISPSNVYDLIFDEATDCFHVILKDAADMKSGATSNITIKIDWFGDYGTYEQSLSNKNIKGLKTTTLKLAIKDASNTVKAK